jgi:hypothetical protein
MPKVDVVFYKEDDGTIPFLAWLDEDVAIKRRDKFIAASDEHCGVAGGEDE